MLTRERQIAIEIAVVELLEDYGFHSYPRSIREVLQALDVDLIRYSDLADEEQKLVNLASRDKALNVTSHDYMRAQVVCDDTAGSDFLRARFSGGHEVGHIWLEHEEDTPNREEEADYFSGYLLAPHPLVITLPSGSAGHAISDRFGVGSWCASFARDQAKARQKEGGPWRPHEKWLLEHSDWKGGGLFGRA